MNFLLCITSQTANENVACWDYSNVPQKDEQRVFRGREFHQLTILWEKIQIFQSDSAGTIGTFLNFNYCRWHLPYLLTSLPPKPILQAIYSLLETKNTSSKVCVSSSPVLNVSCYFWCHGTVLLQITASLTTAP